MRWNPFHHCFFRGALAFVPTLALALAHTHSGAAEPTPGTPPATLRALFQQAWQRAPEAQSASLRQQAAQAERASAGHWTPAAPALRLEAQSDRWSRNAGNREWTLGLNLPLWLPGERMRKAALGDAELGAVQQRQQAAQLELAGKVREAWWAWQRARSDAAQAQLHGENARQLAADVQRRFAAGDLARTEHLQAQASEAQAQAALAEAQGALAAARAVLAPWMGPQEPTPGAAEPADPPAAEPEVAAAAQNTLMAQHPALGDWQAQAQVARRSAELQAAQRRGNPELSLATTRSRGDAGERYAQTLALGLTVPLGGGQRSQAKESAALAQALEAETRAVQEQERLMAVLHAAQARAAAAAQQSQALAHSAALAEQTRQAVAKAFAMGEADWPTRLRVEQDAALAMRQAARARIDAAAAQSELRQALGLLPE